MSRRRLNFSPEIQRSFTYEKLSEFTLPGALVLLEGGVVGVIAAKVYDVEPFTLALISAAPMFANLSSLFWSKLASGRRKVPAMTAIQIIVMFCVLAVAVAPINELGAFVLVSSMIFSRICVAGLTTLRSVIWSLNYARHNRAKATSQIQMINSLVTVAISSAIGPFLDAFPTGLGLLYGAGAILGIVGILFFSRVKVQGEVEQLLDEQRQGAASEKKLGIVQILRQDKRFARYQLSMFAAGFGNMLMEAPLIFLITREMQASYTTSLMIVMVIPMVMSLVSLPLWAIYLDRVHVAQFRARQSVLWVVAQLFTFIGAILGSLTWLYVGRFIMGITRGGGTLAWQLGHNDFAPANQLSQYMGVHVTLTGLRGATAPFIGIFLYTGWEGAQWSGIGPWIFALAAAVSGLSGWGFNRLYQSMKKDGSLNI